MTSENYITEQIKALYPQMIDQLHLQEIRKMLSEITFVDEYIDNPRTDMDEILPSRILNHHISEAKNLLEQSRFTIQDYQERMSFLMSDLWLVMERLDSVKKQIDRIGTE